MEAEEVKKYFADAKEKIEELRGFVGIAPGQFAFVTPPVYKKLFPDDPSKWPVFKLRPRLAVDFDEDVANPELFANVDGKRTLQTGRFRKMRIRQSVAAINNFRDMQGQIIPLAYGEDGRLTPSSVDSMKADLQLWLIEQIDAIDSISPEESDALKF